MKTSIDITEANFEMEVLKSEQPVLVEFATGWAFPSMMLNGFLEEIASESECLKIARVKLDDSPNLGLWYGIRCIPTVLCFVDGEERIGFFGRTSKEAILTQLRPVIKSRPQSDPDSVAWA
jgi:thioredoxin 1